jgi:phosphoglycolate phosphatase-like HAD superfamily hydrolase
MSLRTPGDRQHVEHGGGVWQAGGVILVLWDIDGTLVDSAGHGRHAFDEAFEAVVGRPLEGEFEFAGRTDHQIAMTMLETVDDADGHLPRLLQELERALAQREELIREQGRAYPGVPEALAAVAERHDMTQSLLTGNLQPNAVVKLAAFGLDRWIDFDIGAYGSDPHEERSDLVAVATERAEARLGEPVEPVLIGDTPLDVKAARDGGARAIAVMTGFADPDALRESKPDALFEDLSDTAAAMAAIAGR